MGHWYHNFEPNPFFAAKIHHSSVSRWTFTDTAATAFVGYLCDRSVDSVVYTLHGPVFSVSDVSMSHSAIEAIESQPQKVRLAASSEVAALGCHD